MSHPRPLRDVFDELAGVDPAGALAAGGHGDLPGELVAEAIVSYAGTAPVEVAEHLSRFVTAHSGVLPDGPVDAVPDPASGLDLLATAPAGLSLPDPAPLAGTGDPVPTRKEDPQFGAGASDPPDAPPAEPDTDPYGLDFGVGELAGADPEPDYPDLTGPEPEPIDGFAALPAPTGPDPAEPGAEEAGGLAG